MKLNVKVHTAASRVEKIKLESGVVELLDAYIQFYQQELNATITSEQAMLEMITAFIKSDRNFMRWFKQQDNTNK